MDDRYLDHPYQLAGRSIDPVGGTVVYNGQHGSLSRKQLEVLALLASEGRTVPREEFIRQVWDGDELVGRRGLNNAIYALRRSLQDADAKHPLIRTIPRRGYQLSAEAQLAARQQNLSFVEGWPVPGRPSWRLQRLLSRSDTAETWRARHTETREQRIFRFCRSEEHLRRLRREVKVLRFLREKLADHQGSIAGIVDWQLDEPPYFLEMEPTAYGSLADWSAARGGLRSIPLEERIRLLAQAASALDTLHGLGVVHRNLSPASLLIDEERGRPIAKLGELGLGQLTPETASAESSASEVTTGGLTLATGEGESTYLPPEHRDRQAPEAAGDIYALGVLILQVVLGDWHRTSSAESLEAIESPTLREIVADCVADHPQERPTAEQLYQRLQSSLANVIEQASAATLPEPISPRPVQEGPGQSIGPFRLLEVLGEGGMGTVYLASQRQPVERQVALKLIKAGLDSEHVLGRFEAERQALALMDHDNVAAVYDAGSASGRPYFVMEYVPGLELISHCDHSRLRLRERVELFLQVCHGVHHAHQKGLIHRDLKPSNILVKKHASQPATVKIIDFGVAKSLQRKLSADTVHTLLGTFVGTPRYSSPEQISDHLPDVDTRSDVYSLGVVLYELVTGVTPRSADELAGKSSGELLKILEQDPPTPHSRFSHLDPQQKAEIASSRSRSIAELEQRLHADLSWIILKCLERDPDERYASVLELKKDLERWLTDQPIEARPSSGVYRMAKFVRRHRTGVALAATVAFLLLATTASAVFGFLRSENKAAEAREAALEAEKAAEFLVDLLQSVDPAVLAAELREDLAESVGEQAARRGSVSAEEKQRQLDRLLQGVNFTDLVAPRLDTHFFESALERIEEGYQDFPLLQARLWQATALTRATWGRLEDAIEPQEWALSIRQSQLGADDPLSLVSLHLRGELRHSLGQHEEAEADLRSAVSGLRRVSGPQAPDTLKAIHSLGFFLTRKGEFIEAEQLLEEALQGSRQVLGEGHAETMEILHNMAQLLEELGRLDEAEALHKEALEGRIELFGEKHPATVNSMASIGVNLRKQAKFEEAEKWYRQARELSSRLLGEGQVRTLNMSANLAELLGTLGQLEEAERLAREVLAGYQRHFGEVNPYSFVGSFRLGTILAKKGKLEEAEIHLQTSVRGQSALRGDNHPRTLIFKASLATLLLEMGRLDEAEENARDAVTGHRRSHGEEHPRTLVFLRRLAAILVRQGRLEEAESLQSQALEAQRRTLGDEHPETLMSIRGTGDILRARGELKEAEARYRQALAGLESAYGASGPDVLRTKERLAELLGRQSSSR